MKKNDLFENRIADYRPELSDDEEFMSRFVNKMDTIETVRRYCQHERHRLRCTFVVAFLSGIPVGIALTLFFIFHPLPLHLTAQSWTLPLLRFFAHNASLLISGLVVISISAVVAYVCTLFYNLFAFRSASSQQK
jgi:hypothetical protein